MYELEEDSVDVRFQVRGERAPAADVVVVAIDPETFQVLDRTWPFPRSDHARVIDRLRRDGAAQIVYDVQFTEPTDAREDRALIDAVARAQGVVLATAETTRAGRTNVFGGDGVVRSLGARAGHSEFDASSDGTFRRYPYELDGLESIAVAAVELRDGVEVDPGRFDDGEAWIDYAGPPQTISRVSFGDVWNGDFEPGTFDGATVVVGASAATLQDVHATPYGEGLMPGPEIQANAISTLSAGNSLDSVPGALQVALIVLMAAVPPALNLRFGALNAFAIGAALGALYLVAAQLAFSGGTILPVVDPLVALAVGAVIGLAVNYLIESFRRQRTRDTFARFVPDEVVGRLLAEGEGGAHLGAERVEVTVLFSDVRGFTTFSESRPPEQVVEVLNRYLSEMTGAILDNGGTLVAYLGDGIMALFGAPLDQPDHADRALAAAREMVGPRLEAFNAWGREHGLDDAFRMGIGLNTGPVMCGMIGSERRLDYNAIGDTCNTASRLEGMTKDSGHAVFVSESTRQALSDSTVGLVSVGALELRGREGTIRVWAPTTTPAPQPVG